MEDPPIEVCKGAKGLVVPIPILPVVISVYRSGVAPVPVTCRERPDMVPVTLRPRPSYAMLSAPVIVSPPISTYLLSASLWSSIFDVPQVSVPSLCVVMIEQLARLVTAREVPVIPPAISSFVCGVVSPIPTFPPSVVIAIVPPSPSINLLIALIPKSVDACPANTLFALDISANRVPLKSMRIVGSVV